VTRQHIGSNLVEVGGRDPWAGMSDDRAQHSATTAPAAAMASISESVFNSTMDSDL
jgi:hypothetical protein